MSSIVAIGSTGYSHYDVYNAMVLYSSLCHLWLTMVLWHFPGSADAIEFIESIGCYRNYRLYRFYRATVTMVSTMLWCSISHYGVL
jgi:hypothetical protein